MLLKISFFLLYLFFVQIQSAVNVPVWTIYSQMYSGQHDASNTTKAAGSSFTCVRGLTTGSSITYSTAPKLILSLMGFAQNSPANGNIGLGFDVRISAINLVNFTTQHNVYGADLYYISYMFLGIDQSLTGFQTGQYTQIMSSSNQSIDILNNVGQIYSNYGTNIIQMKGFLVGYKLQQKTTGTCIYFSLAPKNQTAFTITVSTLNDVVIQQIWYYRIGYDRTALQRKTFNDVFFKFNFLLQNGSNIYSADFMACASQNCFFYGYRNFLMGTNKINIGAIGRTQFFLQYYFSSTKAGSNPSTQANPSNAAYLQGQLFLHMIQSCPNITTPYFLKSTLFCNTACPLTNYYTNTSSKTCQLCHYSCLTCSLPFSSVSCLSCDTTKRLSLNNNSQCLCGVKTYDDGVNLQCQNCDYSCLTCTFSTNADCLSCNSSNHRSLNDNNLDGKGSCDCLNQYYQNISDIGGLCIKCQIGCLTCTFSGGSQICSLCDTSNHWTLNSSTNSCDCEANYYINSQICIAQMCGNGILTPNQQCDDNNTIEGDGCSSTCLIQPNHACILNSSLASFSICYYDKPIGLRITELTKSAYSNQVNLKIQISADGCNSNFLNNYLTINSSLLLQSKSRLLSSVQNQLNLKQRYIVLASSVLLTITNIHYSKTDGILYITFNYDQTFSLQEKIIKFVPSSSISESFKKYFYDTPAASVSLQPSYNKIQTTYFDNSEYIAVLILRQAYFVLLILFWIASAALIIIKKGNVATQLMIIYQLSYLCLLSQSKIQIGFGGLAQFGKYTIGINIDLQSNNNICKNFLALNLNCSLLNNINITLFFILGVAFILILLKLYQKGRNYIAYKQFLEIKQQKELQKYIQNNNSERESNLSQQQRSNSNSSKNSEASQVFFKQQQFIDHLVYQYLYEVLYFFIFITVMIWGVSLNFIKEQAGGSIAIALTTAFVYAALWIVWFVTYHSMNISFTISNNQIINQNQIENENKSKSQRSSSLSPKVLKILYYPFLWLCFLCLSILLGLSQPVGYLSQAVVIAFTLLLSVLIWIFQFYSIKLQNLRAIINCAIIVCIQIIYLVSQAKDSVIGAGIQVSAMVFTFLCISLVINCLIQGHLFILQVKKRRRDQIQSDVNEIVQQINVLKKNKKKIQDQNLSQYKSAKSKSIKSPLLQIKTTKKNPVYEEQPEQNQEQLREKIKLNKKQLQQLLKTKRIQGQTDRGNNLNDTFRQSTFRGIQYEHNSLTNNVQAGAELTTGEEVISKLKALPQKNLANYLSRAIEQQEQEQI